DLIVRGMCCLRPGLPGVSDNIRVQSIVGRFLEHSRLWQFTNGGDEEFYLGSADWMPRNFDRRVEAVAPIETPALHERVRTLLRTYLADERMAWDLGPDGTWTQRNPDSSARPSHELLIKQPWGTPRERSRLRRDKGIGRRSSGTETALRPRSDFTSIAGRSSLEARPASRLQPRDLRLESCVEPHVPSRLTTVAPRPEGRPENWVRRYQPFLAGRGVRTLSKARTPPPPGPTCASSHGRAA